MSAVGRNDPCPCGSGKKYKKCCLPRDEALALTAAPAPEPAANEPAEEPFTTLLRPDLDKAVDQLLQRLERGQGRGLRPELEALLREHPEYHMTNYAMGVYLGMVEQQPVAAIPFFEKAVRIFPLLTEAHYNLGGSYVKACRVADAVASYRKAIRYSRNDNGIDAMARQRIAELEQLVKRNSQCPTIDAYVENQKLFDRAFEHLRRQQYKEAVELFSKVLEQDPGHVQSCGNLGLAYAGLGRRASALECLDKALALDPSYAPARNNRLIIREMKEGEPHIPGIFAETEFYREQFEAEEARKARRGEKTRALNRAVSPDAERKARKAGWWDMVKALAGVVPPKAKRKARKGGAQK